MRLRGMRCNRVHSGFLSFATFWGHVEEVETLSEIYSRFLEFLNDLGVCADQSEQYIVEETSIIKPLHFLDHLTHVLSLERDNRDRNSEFHKFPQNEFSLNGA